MVFLFDCLPTPSLAMVTGVAGLTLGTLSTILSDRFAILAAQAGAAALFVGHFLLLGASTGALMCALSFVQVATALPESRPRWLGAVYTLTVPAALAVAALTWQGPMSALAAAGFVMGTVGRWQESVAAMRLFFLAGTVLGAGHNALAGSMVGLGSDALALSGHLWSLWRDRPSAGRRLAPAF